MAHWKLEDREQARAAHARAERWLKERPEVAPAYGPLRAEAAALLGVGKSAPKQDKQD
jgi:hypothetical protein